MPLYCFGNGLHFLQLASTLVQLFFAFDHETRVEKNSYCMKFLLTTVIIYHLSSMHKENIKYTHVHDKSILVNNTVTHSFQPRVKKCTHQIICLQKIEFTPFAIYMGKKSVKVISISYVFAPKPTDFPHCSASI